MDAGVIATRLRSAGYLPALRDGKVRLYGDVDRLSAYLRDVLNCNREAVVAYLGQPEQAVAYDLLAAAAEAGWCPVVTAAGLAWRRDEERTANPMRTPAWRDALEHHRDAVMLLLHAPSGGPQHITPSASAPPAAVLPGPPPEGPYHRIWTCARCHLPRSGDDRPCPGCGAVEGYVALRPANRFTGLRRGPRTHQRCTSHAQPPLSRP